MHHERYLYEAQRMSETKEARNGSCFKTMPFECTSNGMQGAFQWTRIKARLEKLHAKVMADIETWRSQGSEQTSLLKAHHDASVNRCARQHPLHPGRHALVSGAVLAPSLSVTWFGRIFLVRLSLAFPV
eukprot:2475291-Pleurochrysis_carterae.AAC.3